GPTAASLAPAPGLLGSAEVPRAPASDGPTGRTPPGLRDLGLSDGPRPEAGAASLSPALAALSALSTGPGAPSRRAMPTIPPGWTPLAPDRAFDPPDTFTPDLALTPEPSEFRVAPWHPRRADEVPLVDPVESLFPPDRYDDDDDVAVARHPSPHDAPLAPEVHPEVADQVDRAAHADARSNLDHADRDGHRDRDATGDAPTDAVAADTVPAGDPGDPEATSRDPGAPAPAADLDPRPTHAGPAGPLGPDASPRAVAEARRAEAPPPIPDDPLPSPAVTDQVRIRLDRELSVDVHTRGHRVDVTVRGTDPAVEPLKGIGPELDASLVASGFSLGSFSARGDQAPPQPDRDDDGAPAVQSTSGPDDAAPAPPRWRVGRYA
ncbi:MAG: hypothetical protein ABMB14_20930, partial [Myxococcota bacterium]